MSQGAGTQNVDSVNAAGKIVKDSGLKGSGLAR